MLDVKTRASRFYKELGLICLLGIGIVIIGGCASSSQRPYSLTTKAPIYVASSDKGSYHFSLLVLRQLSRNQVELAKSSEEANTIVYLSAPKCRRYVIFTNAVGDRTGYMIECSLDYKLGSQDGEDLSSSLLASSILTQTPNINAYFNREDIIYDSLHQNLARQLILALATIEYN